MAKQKIAIAVQKMNLRSGRSASRQKPGNFLLEAVRGIVADPGLEQVAENPERFGTPSRALQKGPELFGDVGSRPAKMQVGDEQRQR